MPQLRQSLQMQVPTLLVLELVERNARKLEHVHACEPGQLEAADHLSRLEASDSHDT